MQLHRPWIDSSCCMRHLILISLLCAVSVMPLAADWDPFLVRDLDVSAQAEDAVAAKDAALREAQRKGLSRVLRRIASREDLRRLPEPTADLAAGLMDAMSIGAERASADRYRASVTVSFDPDAVRRHLDARAVRYLDRAAPEVLLIPVVLRDDQALLWEGAEAWRSALMAEDMAEGLTPVLFPRNSPEDRQERVERLLAGDAVSLDTFRVRYRTEGAVVAVLDEAAAGRRDLLLVGSDAAGAVNERVKLGSDALEIAAQRVGEIFSERWKRAMAGSLVGRQDDRPARIGVPAAREAEAIAVHVLLRGVNEWDDIRRRLRSSDAVAALRVDDLSPSQARIAVWPRDRADDLAAALVAVGLDLFRAGDAWILQPY